jgi:putative transposase
LLLKFAKDRLSWMRWLYEARKRFGLVVLDYVVTCNHVHLIVYGNNGDATIPRSIQLLAGRSGQQYIKRQEVQRGLLDPEYSAVPH